ncbi:hypothetical protein ACFVZD_32665 [Streptomyces sp. NPDC058287]|uniref:hypothetical protein n=1 Tax=unclassified Streptomyces TaxID=2593676 RepID=UPI0036E1A469
MSRPRIRVVGTGSAVDISRQVPPGTDGTPAVLQGMLDASSAARTAEARDEGVQRFATH